jgi:hypothetical protein
VSFVQYANSRKSWKEIGRPPPVLVAAINHAFDGFTEAVVGFDYEKRGRRLLITAKADFASKLER